MQFNLLEDGFIPVLRRNGRFERVGIRAALTEAGRIRQIAASNPMDNVALLRLLLAVLQWCKPRLTDAERAALKDAKGIREACLEKLGTAKQAFNLLGDGERFFQDKATPDNARPIGDLLVEFPTETKIAHFRHVRDAQYGLCPACCALGIVRFCAFANYAGRGYTSGVNGPAPAYAILQGNTLLETLRMYWPANRESHREPPWVCGDPPSLKDLDIVTVFAWRSRRLWLGNPGDEGDCAYCGRRAGLFRQVAFTGNWKPPFQTKGTEKKFWDQDPHLILVEQGEGDEKTPDSQRDETTHPAKRKSTRGPRKTTLGFPRPGRRVMAHAGFWRRALGAATSRARAGKTIMFVGPAASQTGMLYQDAAALRLPCLAAESASAAVLDTLGKAAERMLSVLKRSTPNPQRQHPNRTAALDALSPFLEDDLRRALEESRNVAESAPAADLDWLRERFGPVVEKVVRSTTLGSPLRRREAMRRAASALNDALRKATSKSEEKSPADNTAEAPPGDSTRPKRRRDKGKEGEE